MSKSIKISGKPEIKIRKIATAFHPWEARPVDGSQPHDGASWPVWPVSARSYAKTAFATREAATEWVKKELSKYVKRINETGAHAFGYGFSFIKGTGKIVKVGKGFEVRGKWKNDAGWEIPETYAKAGIDQIEVEVE